MTSFPINQFRKTLTPVLIVLAMLLFLSVANFFTAEEVLATKQDFDRQGLDQFFSRHEYDNDVLVDSFLIPRSDTEHSYVNLQLLGLRRSRLAYIAKSGDEVVAIAVPVTAEDGFNGYIDLLVSVDMYGRISAARVMKDIDSNDLFGVVDVIESQWMKLFTDSTMRDILRISWQSIPAENEYDQFVGASLTPKTVSNRIYDALVFFQSNRIALMDGGSE